MAIYSRFFSILAHDDMVFSSPSLQRVITPNSIAGRLRPIKFCRTRIIRISITITISFTITMGLTTFTKEAYSIVSLKACKCVCVCAIVHVCVCLANPNHPDQYYDGFNQFHERGVLNSMFTCTYVH